MSLLTKIKILCVERNTSMSAVEKELGIGNGTISRWDAVVPSGDKLVKVADYFGVSIDYLLDRTNEKSPGTPELSGVYLSYAKEAADSGISPDDIKLAIETIKRLRGK